MTFSLRAQVIDMLGLMGDSSDNIPGCPGVGEKTAQKLISEFGSIENLLEHTDQLKGALKTKVETNREMITFSKFLATIKIDVPIQLEMDSLVREEADEDSLRSIFEELEFRTLIDRVLKKWSFRKWNNLHSWKQSRHRKKRPLSSSTFSRRRRRNTRQFVCEFHAHEPDEAKNQI